MRKLIRLVSLLTVLLVHAGLAAASQDPVVITLDDVVKRVNSTANPNIHQNALRVYQAKESIQVARMNLLPRLNLWKVAGATIEIALGVVTGTGAGIATGVLGIVEDIAPFLIPANWYRAAQAKHLYLADWEGYRALWANEIMSSKALYVHLLLDRALLEHVEQGQRELERLLTIVRSRELLGGVPRGAAQDIEVRVLALQEDKRSLEVLIAEEETLLAYLMGYSQDVTVRPAGVTMPDFENLEPLDYSDFEYRAVDSAPELRQFTHFIAAADLMKGEVLYSFLGGSTMSRGVAGGVFDSLPIQSGGLGFGAPASMRMISAQKRTLEVQRQGVQETIKRHLKLLVTNYNLDLENYSNLKRRAELTKAINEQLYERLKLGQDVDMINLIEASRNHIQADTSFFAVKFRFLANEDKLARLIFHGDYTKQPVVIESLKRSVAKKPVNGRKGS